MKAHLFISRHPHIFTDRCEALCMRTIAHPMPISQADPDEIADYLEGISALRNCSTCIRVLLKELGTGVRLYVYEISDGERTKHQEEVA